MLFNAFHCIFAFDHFFLSFDECLDLVKHWLELLSSSRKNAICSIRVAFKSYTVELHSQIVLHCHFLRSCLILSDKGLPKDMSNRWLITLLIVKEIKCKLNFVTSKLLELVNNILWNYFMHNLIQWNEAFVTSTCLVLKKISRNCMCLYYYKLKSASYNCLDSESILIDILYWEQLWYSSINLIMREVCFLNSVVKLYHVFEVAKLLDLLMALGYLRLNPSLFFNQVLLLWRNVAEILELLCNFFVLGHDLLYVSLVAGNFFLEATKFFMICLTESLLLSHLHLHLVDLCCQWLRLVVAVLEHSVNEFGAWGTTATFSLLALFFGVSQLILFVLKILFAVLDLSSLEVYLVFLKTRNFGLQINLFELLIFLELSKVGSLFLCAFELEV